MKETDKSYQCSNPKHLKNIDRRLKNLEQIVGEVILRVFEEDLAAEESSQKAQNDIDTFASDVRYFHERKRYAPYIVTFCMKPTNEPTKIGISFSICSPKDMFDRKIGRTFSLERLRQSRGIVLDVSKYGGHFIKTVLGEIPSSAELFSANDFIKKIGEK